MPFSDITKSGIQTASSSLGSSDLVSTMSSSSPTASSGNVVPTTRRMVRFGAVNVHKHRMTMGYNPSCEEGIPVTIDWSVQEWEFYEDPDAHIQAKEQQQQQESSQTESSNTNSNKNSSVVPKKLSQALREQIAQRNHTSDSILKVQDELDQIRRSRIAGTRDIYNATLMLQLQDDGYEEEEIEPAKSQNEHGNDDETKKRFLRRKIVGCRSNRKFYLIKRRQHRVLILMQEQSGTQPQ